jgi:SAM-dependent methyltransferase
VKKFLRDTNLAEPWHNRRYLLTFEKARPELQRARQVLDLGGRSPFTALLERFTRAEVTCQPFDLRYPFPLPEASYDVVFCLEVIEHLKDRDESERADFTFSGVLNCLRESLRVLRPGGLLVLSTPNVCSYRSLRNVLAGRHPFQFAPHNRELSPGEVAQLLRETGFGPLDVTTVNAWYNGGGSFWRVKLLLWALGISRRHREDCILALARRPEGDPGQGR